MRLALFAAILLATAGAQDSSGTLPESEVPPIPSPKFQDAAQGEQYEKGVAYLKDQAYKDAEKIFRKLRRAAPAGEEREAAQRCYRESTSGVELLKASAQMQKGQGRKALSTCGRALEEAEGTLVGLQLEELHEICYKEIYFDIADFEEDKSEKEKDDDDLGGGGRRGGSSGFGLNTRIVTGTRKDGKVRQGKRALGWRTGRNLSYLTFEGVKGEVSDKYRYLNLSIRAEDPKAAPQLRLLFDCDESSLDWGGGRGGRGGRRGGSRIFNRMGFQTAISTSGKWQDFRIDLGKFKQSGDVTWADVIALRIAHLPGGEGRILLDQIRLEKK